MWTDNMRERKMIAEAEEKEGTQKGTADNEFWIKTEDVPRVEKKIAQYNKSIRKGGTGGWNVQKIKTRNYERKVETKDENGNKIEKSFYIPQTLVRLEGDPPVIEGWELIGVIDHKNGNVIREVPGQTMPEAYRHADPKCCDHCGVRRTRSESFIFYNKEKDDYIQVGRSCLKDFFTNENASKYFQALEWMNKYVEELDAEGDDEVKESFSRGSYEIDLIEYLSYVAMVIDIDKEYVSRSASDSYNSKVQASEQEAEEQGKEVSYQKRIDPTSSIAISDMFNKGKKNVPEPNKKHEKIAEDAREYYLGTLKDKQHLTSFEYNLKQLLQQDTIAYKYLGYVAFVVADYMRQAGILQDEMSKKKQERDQAKQDREQAWERKKNSQYIGNEGDKVELIVTVNNGKYFPAQKRGWKDSFMYMCTTEDYNEISFFTQYRDIFGVAYFRHTEYGDDFVWDKQKAEENKGVKYHITGNVKQHREWNGIKSTTLNYVKVLETLEEDTDMRKRIQDILSENMPISNSYTYAQGDKERTLSQWYLVVDTRNEEEYVWTFHDGLSVEKFNSPRVIGVDAFIDEMLSEYNDDALILSNNIVYAIEEKEYHELAGEEKAMILNSLMSNVSKKSELDREQFDDNFEVYQLYLPDYV